MKLSEHPDFGQSILRAAEHFRARGLRPAIIEKDYYVTEALRIVAATGDKVIFKGRLAAPSAATTTKQSSSFERGSAINAKGVSGRGCPSGSHHSVGSSCAKLADRSKDEHGGNSKEN